VTDKPVSDQALDVDADDGCVVLVSAHQVELRLTPNAAEETSERLLQASMKARGQRYFRQNER
jgi:hypothetical protein